MIKGRLKTRRVLIENEADASTLRNRGFVGRNQGQKLSLDLITSLHLLLRKRIEIKKGQDLLSAEQIEGMMTDDERRMATAFHFLKDKGMKPVVRRGKLIISNLRVLLFQDNETIDFLNLSPRTGYLCIADWEGNCLLYSINKLPLAVSKPKSRKRGNRREKMDFITAMIESKGMRVESGFKYGCEFRIYEGDSSHAKFLMTVANKSLSRDIVARVRIAQSVRKIFIQAVSGGGKNELMLFEIKWIRL